MPRLAGALRSEGLELLHTHGLWMYASIASMRWSGGRKPYIISPHGMLDSWALRNSAWKKKLAGWAYENRHLRGAACLHALNDAEARSIRDYGLRNPICIIPNGVELPDEFGRGSGRPKVCLFLGRLHPKKGLAELIRAWAAVPHDGWTLAIAGWGEAGYVAQLETLAASLGVSGSVSFLGPRFGKEKHELLDTASAFVLPSFSEGLPMAVLEAWSYGLPVAMTPECNIPEGFEAGAAVRIEPTVDSVAAGLEKLFAMDDGRLRDMGTRGRRLVEKRFTWPRVAAEMIKVYEWVLGRGPQPACVQLS